MKKFPSIDWQRPVFVIATWVVRLRHVTYVFAGMILLLLVAALLDPQRPARTQERVAQLREVRARDEARIADQARAAPAAGQVALDFHKLDFRLPPEADESTGRGGGYNRWLPAGIKVYDGREIGIEGFMMPTKLENGLVREFLVLANQMTCCYAALYSMECTSVERSLVSTRSRWK